MNSAPVFVGEVLKENISQSYGWGFWFFVIIAICLIAGFVYFLFKEQYSQPHFEELDNLVDKQNEEKQITDGEKNE